MKKVAILDEIASETNGKSYKTYKYCFDGVDVPRMDYDDHKQQFTWKDHGETEYHDKPISLKQYADRIIVAQPPLFCFFLMVQEKHTKLMIWHIQIEFIQLLPDKLASVVVNVLMGICFLYEAMKG